MIEWILILTFYAGTLSKSDSAAMIYIPGFKTEAECKTAGQQAKDLETLMKASKFVCVQRTK